MTETLPAAPPPDVWRDLVQRFPELPADCGDGPDAGIIDTPDFRDWSRAHTTPDQLRMEDYLDRFDLRGKRILHIGIGNSSLAMRFHRRAREIVGTTIDAPEVARAQSLGLANYRAVLHNKYSGPLDVGPFDFIMDNNPTSSCCCLRHLSALLEFYRAHLNEGGQVVTDATGLGWLPEEPPRNPRWSFDFCDWAAAGAAAGLQAYRQSRHLYLLVRRAPDRPDWRSLSVHFVRQVITTGRRLCGRVQRKLKRTVRRSRGPHGGRIA